LSLHLHYINLLHQNQTTDTLITKSTGTDNSEYVILRQGYKEAMGEVIYTSGRNILFNVSGLCYVSAYPW